MRVRVRRSRSDVRGVPTMAQLVPMNWWQRIQNRWNLYRVWSLPVEALAGFAQGAGWVAGAVIVARALGVRL